MLAGIVDRDDHVAHRIEDLQIRVHHRPDRRLGTDGRRTDQSGNARRGHEQREVHVALPRGRGEGPHEVRIAVADGRAELVVPVMRVPEHPAEVWDRLEVAVAVDIAPSNAGSNIGLSGGPGRRCLQSPTVIKIYCVRLICISASEIKVAVAVDIGPRDAEPAAGTAERFLGEGGELRRGGPGRGGRADEEREARGADRRGGSPWRPDALACGHDRSPARASASGGTGRLSRIGVSTSAGRIVVARMPVLLSSSWM